MKKAAVLLWLIVFLLSLLAIGGEVHASNGVTFAATELLGRPTDTSITVNVVPSSSGQVYFQYGEASGSYTGQTDTAKLTSGTPADVVMSGLTPNTKYYYRMESSSDGSSWTPGAEHSFHTQRPSGTPDNTFKFTITSDSHAQFNTAYQNAMTNILNEHPDFTIDLGDTFMLDGKSSQSAVNNAYLASRNSAYMGAIGPSIPIFLASGNHEDEEGWNLDDTPFSIALGSIQARKAYFPTPINDGFYSGNIDPLAAINAATYGDQYREDYYAWTWGDALFVVIDEFQYTMNLPYTPTAGEGSDDSKTGDQWSWTLGAQQYQWLNQTLKNSNAKYKFIFSHQMTGGIPRAGGYVRGGAEAVAYFEWGGKNADGTEGFAAHRNAADFGTKPIHQLMVDYGVSAYFHGHDHQYVYETRDGIVYQEVPSPSMSGSGFSGIYTAGDHGTYNTIKILPNSGHLLVTVTPEQATVDYVSSTSTAGTVNYSYTIEPNSSTNPPDTKPPALSTIAAVNITSSSADITWTTDESSDSLVDYGTTSRTYASSVYSGQLVTSHKVTLTNLPASTLYYYQVTSVDSVGNKSVSSEQSFKTSSGPPPDFSISASPSSRSVSAGKSTTYTVTLTALNGYSSSVNLTVSGLPSGATYTFSTNPVNLTSGVASSTLTVTTSRNKRGTYTLTITGTDTASNTTHSTTVTLSIR